MIRFFKVFWPWLLVIPFWCVVIALVMCCCSCSRVQYVPVESVRTDSVYLTRWKSDSVHLRDSVFVSVETCSDTVYRTEFRYKVHYRDRITVDTMYCERVDSVRVPYPVEKKLTRWQRFRLNVLPWVAIGLAVIITVIVVVGFHVYRLIK